MREIRGEKEAKRWRKKMEEEKTNKEEEKISAVVIVIVVEVVEIEESTVAHVDHVPSIGGYNINFWPEREEFIFPCIIGAPSPFRNSWIRHMPSNI